MTTIQFWTGFIILVLVGDAIISNWRLRLQKKLIAEQKDFIENQRKQISEYEKLIVTLKLSNDNYRNWITSLQKFIHTKRQNNQQS